MTRQTRARAVISMLGAFLLMAGFMVQFGGSSASAQAMAGHPAHIHTGLCPAPGDVVFPLTDVSSAMSVNGTVTAASPAGATSAIPVEGSVTTVKSALKDLVDGNHSIVVHESMANIGNYIACGDIGGVMTGASNLVVGLGALNGSNETGVAWLQDQGDGTTTVTIFLTSTGEMAPSGTPAADASTSGSAMAVDIKGFAYDKADISIAVGTTVTWTNNDSVPHTVTQDGGGFKSTVINPGETFSYTFDKAGKFTYHCEYHANMKGSVTVQ